MTREEALKVANEMRQWLKTDREKEALETLIQGLKESEDERIIKTLQEYVKNRNWPLNGPTQDEVLAWLERQKEQKPEDRFKEAREKYQVEWSEEDKQWLSEVYFAIDHSMYSEDERQAMKKYIDSLRKDRKACGVDEFSLALRNCLSADSELTKMQADLFVRTYGEDLYKVALGEMKTGLDKEDIEEYRNESEFDPKPGEEFWVRCKTEKSENLWFDKEDERPAYTTQGKDGMMYVVCLNKDGKGSSIFYPDKESFLETFDILESER